MRPIWVRFQCFGPYMQEQYIDFTELEKAGLFLICGETGAGKTTILDAICYALYGRSSGALRGDISVMRCKLAGKQDETRTEYVFEVNGKRYKFVRSLKYGRKKLNDTHNCLLWQDGVWVPVFENPKATAVNKKAEALIGLTYEQFRQVIILPQGQFERLLVSNSEEKEKILVSLFHADRWQRISDEVYRRVAERDEALREEKRWIQQKLTEYRCTDLDDLRALQQTEQTELAALERRETEADSHLTVLRQDRERALLESREFEQLTRLCRQRDALESRAEAFRREREVLARADSAEQIRPLYRRQREAAQRLARAEGLARDRALALDEAKKNSRSAEEQASLHRQSQPEQALREKQMTLLENARGVYASLEEKRETAAAAEKKKAAGQKQLDTVAAALEAAQEHLRVALLAQQRAYQEYQQANQVYMQGISGELAQGLVPDRPCPVCGSTRHPAPAQQTEGHVTRQQLKVLTEAMNRSNGAAVRARELRDLRETERKAAEQAFSQAVQDHTAAYHELKAALSQTLPDIPGLAQLEGELARLRAETEQHQRRTERLEKQLQAARAALAAAEAEQRSAAADGEIALAERDASRAEWQQALETAGFGSEETFRECDLDASQRQQRLTALLRWQTEREQTRTELAEKAALLADRTPPDMAALDSALREKTAQRQALAGQTALTRERCRRLEADWKELSRRMVRYEAERDSTDRDLDFANRLRGRSGISLQRYVLGVMLTAITVQANRLLEHVCAGRYRLYRTDEVAGSAHKSGLELEVLDAHSGDRRSVTTLSGGEKFLVALSLAIGLSTVVQAQGSGIRLEAMFVDEGFGSLDREAAADALEVLQGIGGRAGLVGIISHVESLAEAIPVKIHIEKGKNGSNCRISG